MPASFRFVKGHGTQNDFVLLPDPDGEVHGELTPSLVAALCARHTGIGADGVIRVVRCEAYDDPAAVALRGEAEWFMDYRNADGSLSEMCGNGVRLLARYLADHEGVDTSSVLPIATRAGLRVLRFAEDGRISTGMGHPRVLTDTKVSVGERSWPAVQVSMGNPHAVVFVDSLEEAGTLNEAPAHDVEVFPEGVNVEFVVRRAERHLSMRVHERGSGETRSCGTGACAAMVAAAVADEAWRPGAEASYRVDVLGGELTVTWAADGQVVLTGPAVVVAEGEVPATFAAAATNPLSPGG
ncbi:MAG: Diaminopimelate epimerase [uncultured Nocardioidaceae bacterium]|uniref:Diaminopimelate epimerase n=1 Tax=uncultured Nocardioidaceae bacterium TaxID=253824 RepID=A0A6J4MFZ4_9ACTN|nr:MAG: Diaminopimelate epimerase [uncultured Nocardioidaceae bacterium]